MRSDGLLHCALCSPGPHVTRPYQGDLNFRCRCQTITSERVCDGEALTPGGRHNPSVGRLNSRGGLSRPVARGLPAASLKRSCKTKLGSAPRLSHYLLIFHAMPAGSDTPVNDAAGVLSCTDQRPDEGLVSRCCVVAQADLGGET